jgi:hypothetical protein
MLRRIMPLLVVTVMSAGLGTSAASSIPVCSECTVGLFDQLEMLTNYGTFAPNTIKSIYLGVHFGGGYSELAGLELSIAGLRQVEDGITIIGWEGVSTPPPILFLGPLPAPADTSAASHENGGMNIAWHECVRGNQVLLRINLLTFSAFSNKVFRVMHRFPTSNPLYTQAGPTFIQCDEPFFSAVGARGGCYIANWDGVTPPNCQFVDVPVGVTPATWGSVKGLYR